MNIGRSGRHRRSVGSARRHRLGVSVVSLIWCLTACEDRDDDEPRAVSGEIGEDHFFYECTTIDDAFCRSGFSGFPEKIAVGSVFDIQAKGDEGQTLFVEGASPVMVAPDRGEFVLQRPGFAAFVAFSSGGELRDFVHVRGVEPEAIEIQDAFERPLTTIRMRAGQRTTFTAVPVDEEGDVLAGTLSYRWATLDEGIVEVERLGTTVDVEASREGTTQVRVTLDDLELIVDVIVEGRTSPIEDGGTSPIDASPVTQVPDDGGIASGDDAATGEDSGTPPLLEDSAVPITQGSIDSGAAVTPDADVATDDGGAR